VDPEELTADAEAEEGRGRQPVQIDIGSTNAFESRWKAEEEDMTAAIRTSARDKRKSVLVLVRLGSGGLG
jgi:hypothetical protein